jgi:hypothetical protein
MLSLKIGNVSTITFTINGESSEMFITGCPVVFIRDAVNLFTKERGNVTSGIVPQILLES